MTPLLNRVPACILALLVAACGGADGSNLGLSDGEPSTGGFGGSSGAPGGGSGAGAAAGVGGTGATGGVGGAPPNPVTPFAGDPTGPGPYAVVELPVAVPSPMTPPRPGTLYAPSSDGGATLSPDRPFPLVIVLHGFSATHTLYANFSRHLATWGFVALAFDFFDEDTLNPRHDIAAQEVSSAIDLATGSSSPLPGGVDPSRVATAGHSLGGKIAFFAAAIDPRVTVVIGWDPVDSGGAPCFVDPMGCNRFSIAPGSFPGDAGMMGSIGAATLIFAAPVGSFNPMEHHAERFWEGTESPGMYVFFPSGDHLNWPSGAVEEPITRRTHVAWLLSHFYPFSGLERFFNGDAIEPDIASGRIQVQLR